MKTAVIYARYSCDKQTEQSIDGQLRVCQEYAKRNDIVILNIYIDQAMSGTNDNRPDFQKMIKDSARKEWDYVLVYKLDRFSRNKFEATIHKKTLKDNGVKVLSAMENIPDTPEGIILESLLEGMNQYYSAELSQKVKRGMRETRLKGYFQGGNVLYGYKVDGRKLVKDEIHSEVVKRIYEEFSKGICVREIIERLTAQGIYKNGKKFPMNTVYNILRCERYTGVYTKGEEVIDNMYPAIISRELFDSVQAILKTYQHGKNSIEVTYLLRNKLKCGYCGQSIIGECGTAKSGQRKYYYKCRGRKMKLNDCKKSAMSKDDLEHLIIDTVITELKDPKTLDNAVKYLFELQNKNDNENKLLTAYLKEQKDNEKSINNIVANMERGIVAKATRNRLCELEERQEELERLILIEQSKQTVKITEARIRNFYEQALKYEPQMLINYIVKEIVMYDDRIDIIYNHPLTISPDCENGQGFIFYMKNVRLDKRLILINFIVG
ncbi:MAG: recombinase family protein [Clostridia bacterium]|nr:recombinase family protein [Clostridia bacterium]